MVNSVNGNLGLPWHIAAHAYHADAHKAPAPLVKESQPLVLPVQSVDGSGVDTGHQGREREKSREEAVLAKEWLDLRQRTNPGASARGQKAIDAYQQVESFKPRTL